MTTGAAAARMTFHSAPEAIQGAVAAAILGAGSVHLGSSEHCAKMLHDALSKESKETDLDAVALKTVEALGKQSTHSRHRPWHSHRRRSAGRKVVRSGPGNPSLRPLLRIAQENRQNRRPKSRQALAGQRHGRHCRHFARYGYFTGRCPRASRFSAARWAGSPMWAKKFAGPSPGASPT